MGGDLDLLAVALRLPALLLGIGLHEFAHAWTAWKLGDSTPMDEGRVSLNPLDHLDPIGTLCMFVGPLGWGKPVMVNPSAFRDPLRDMMRVALAGPMMNLFIASVACVVTELLQPYLPYDEPWALNVRIALFNIFSMNLGLAAFNLIPVPPLDGSKVVRAVGSPAWAEAMGRLEVGGAGMMIMLALIFTGAVDLVFKPVVWFAHWLQGGLWPALSFLCAAVVAWVVLLRSMPRYF